jgi:endonuclease G
MRHLSLYIVAILAVVALGVLLTRRSISAESAVAGELQQCAVAYGSDTQERGLELPAKCNSHPDAVELKVMCSGELNYTALYDTRRYASLWVAYTVDSDDMGSVKRPSSWSYNPLLSISDQVNLCSHSYNDDYSRGHLIPNASRNSRRDRQEQTFYVTNSVPQIQDRFNGGVWMHLESAVQHYAEQEPLYVTAGVVFKQHDRVIPIRYTTAKDDTKEVPVPNYFYKVVLHIERDAVGDIVDAEAIGFWFEHRQYTDKYYNYAISVDEVERLTGFDFFASLPDNLESKAERMTRNFLVR